MLRDHEPNFKLSLACCLLHDFHWDSKPPANVPQPNQVIIQRWGNCSPCIEIIFVTLTDGGHTWPDRGDNLGFDANAEVLRFFLRHQR